MKSAYVVCALLCVTIGTLVLADDNAKGSSNGTQLTNNKDVTTAVPLIAPDKPTTTPNSTATTASSTTISTSSTMNTPTTANVTTATPAPTHAPTTEPTTVPTNSTSIITTPSIPTTHNSSTAGPRTTAVPAPSPSPSKDRHFDGLSFFGGIILATCLMAIAVFAWKFYRQCNEGNYRTL